MAIKVESVVFPKNKRKPEAWFLNIKRYAPNTQKWPPPLHQLFRFYKNL